MATEDITELLAAWRQGEDGAVERLMPLVYDELRRLAHRRLGGRGQTLQTTAVVHEAYLKLAAHSRLAIKDRQHFFALAAKAMRQLVVDHARRRTATKRGGSVRRVSLEDNDLAIDTQAADVLALDEALARLAALDETLSRVVELRSSQDCRSKRPRTCSGAHPEP